jgi:putative sigma-54 modulation protein
MNISWTGKQEFLHPEQQKNLDAKIAKISKLLDGGGKRDKQAHIILAQNKNQYRAEITLNFLDHQVVGEHADSDQFTAINMAIDKFEKQLIKVRDKRRDTKKGPREGWDKGAAANAVIAANPGPDGLRAAPVEPATNGRPRVFRVTPGETKPMTAEEAVVEIEPGDQYLVYLDADSNRPAVILRRTDGNFDLVQC